MAADSRRHRSPVAAPRRRARRPPLQGAAAGRRRPAPSASWPPSAATCSPAASPPRCSPSPPSAWSTTSPLMETYAERHGLAFAPHGKTSMAPQLFERQLEHGAWGITLAVPHQVRVARAFGIQRIFLANELVDAAALRWLAAELDADPGFRFVCYVDSVRGVELMDAALRGGGRRAPVDVVVELAAGEGARTGRPHGGRVRGRRRRGGRDRAPCGWSASRATRARCRGADRERVTRLAAPAHRPGRRLRRGGPLRRARRDRASARAAAPGSTRSPTSSPRCPSSPGPC